MERAEDGELHHAASLARLLVAEDILKYHLTGPLAWERKQAAVRLAYFRRRHMPIPPSGRRRDPNQKGVSYEAWYTEQWKEALGL